MSKIYYIFITVLFFILIIFMMSVDGYSSNESFKPMYTKVAPKIDGDLKDNIWNREPDLDEYFISCIPAYGEKISLKTKVWMAYDEENLYFAFFCEDEPDKIKTSITKRDNIWDEDWIGFNIDTFGNRQSGYVLATNPNGIQGDSLVNGLTAEIEPDYVWYSGGKVLKDGYAVEIHMPLKNFRYKSGENVAMNIIFQRKITRIGLRASWPDKKPGATFLSVAKKIEFTKLDSQLKLEVLPSVTYGSVWERQNPDEWKSASDSTEFGVTAKYGISSSINAEVTINPDYSQVESDEFQVLVNQRYPIFYSEKRPFFMETGNIFKLATSGDGGDFNMLKTVHTRKIIDPAWGAKINGQFGDITFSLLATEDKWPGRAINGEKNQYLGENATYLIGRSKLTLGKDSYIGVIYTGREFAEGYNHVIGSDFSFRLWDEHIFEGKYLFSNSKDTETQMETDGSAYSLSWMYVNKYATTFLIAEHYDTDFRMDTSYIYRTGIDRLMGILSLSAYPGEGSASWIKRVNVMAWGYYVLDEVTNAEDYLYFLALRTYYSKDASLRIDYRKFSEYWNGVQLEGDYFFTFGQIKLTSWLYLYGILDTGDAPYYDPSQPMVGDKTTVNLMLIIQPNEKLTQELYFTYEQMNDQITEDLLYDVNIITSKTTFQLNKYLFLRGIVQYDSYNEVILSDLLASFTLIPGTVLHLGYGSLHQNLEWQNNKWQQPGNFGQYYQTTQSLFFKASYLFQM